MPEPAIAAFERFLLLEASGQGPAPADFLEAQPKSIRAAVGQLLDDLTLLRESRGHLTPLSKGARIGPFELIDVLGSGGAGTVWQARDERLHRDVALKLLRPHLTLSEKQVRRFRREARTSAGIAHPNVCAVYEVGEVDGIHFIAQQLVTDGRTVADLIREKAGTLVGALHDREVAELMRATCSAVAEAHSAGIIHRDIKPANILLDELGRPLLTDFGLARLLDDQELTHSSNAAGTPLYLSPEQASGDQELDVRSDVFSLGVTLYELLTLQRPFQGDTNAEVLRKVLIAAPSDPRRVRRRVPRELALICLHALERARERRYADAGELCRELERWLAGEPILTQGPSLWNRAQRAFRVHPVRSTTLALGLLVLPSLGLLAQHNHGLRLEAESDNAILRSTLDAAQATVTYMAPENIDRRGTQPPAFIATLAASAHEALVDEPVALSAQLAMAGRFYRDLGFNAEAAETLGAAADLLVPHVAPLDPTLVQLRLEQLEALYWLFEVETAHELALGLVETLREAPTPDPVLTARVLASHQRLLSKTERHEAIEALESQWGPLTGLLEHALVELGGSPERVIEAALLRMELAGQLALELDYERAAREMEAALAVLESNLPRDHFWTLRSEQTYNRLLLLMDRGLDCISRSEDLLVRCNKSLGSAHPLTNLVVWQLAQANLHLGNTLRARGLYEVAKEGLQDWLPPTSLRWMALRTAYSITLRGTGRVQEALQMLEELITLKQEVLGPDHTSTIISRRARAECLIDLQRYREAWDDLADQFERLEKSRSNPLDPQLLVTLYYLMKSATLGADWARYAETQEAIKGLWALALERDDPSAASDLEGYLLEFQYQRDLEEGRLEGALAKLPGLKRWRVEAHSVTGTDPQLRYEDVREVSILLALGRSSDALEKLESARRLTVHTEGWSNALIFMEAVALSLSGRKEVAAGKLLQINIEQLDAQAELFADLRLRPMIGLLDDVEQLAALEASLSRLRAGPGASHGDGPRDRR